MDRRNEAAKHLDNAGEDVEEIRFDTMTIPAGQMQRLTPLVRRYIAPNPSPFTFTGTCAYIVGNEEIVLIDPGPNDPDHVAKLLESLDGEKIAAVLITHTHRDHSPAAALIRAATGAPVVGCAPVRPRGDVAGAAQSHDLAYAPDHVLQDGETLPGDGFSLIAVATPGHASNHLAYALPQEQSLFSGDHVMAWSTTVVSPPDGSLHDYMESLDKLLQRDDTIYWPGHGGPVREPQHYVRALKHHRRLREAAILARLAAGDEDITALVANIYTKLDPRLMGGAASSVFAHLIDLAARGLVVTDGPATLAAHYRLA